MTQPLNVWANTPRGAREQDLRNAVMAALQHLNSSNYGQALAALHQAIVKFDEYVKADFAAQDAKLAKRKPKRRRHK